MLDKQKIKYGVHEDIANKIILVDGIARSGKSLFNNIIPSFENVEHTRHFLVLEHILPAIAQGSVSPQFAKAFFRVHINELAYNSLLSRNVNFRVDDLTGIFNSKDPSEYIKRTYRKEGDGIVEELRKTIYYFPFRTHDIMANLEYFNMLDIDYYMLALFRNPIDMAHSCWKRGWGERFGNDPRAFTLTIKFKGQQMPWYCAGYEEEWLTLNMSERCILAVVILIQKSVEQYKKVNDKKRIYLLKFEEFLNDPNGEIKKISSFLGIKETIYTDFFLRKDPRLSQLEPAKKNAKISDLKANTRKDFFKRIMDITEEYDSIFYGFQ